jgi:DNA-binding CsgD family transcriptional regulator
VNTVESHLRRVYAKLGIRSRRELIVRFALGDDEDGVRASS